MSLESGIGSTMSRSSVEDFFKTFLPSLEQKIGQEGECLSEFGDQINYPENVVRDLAIRQSSPVRQPKQQVPPKSSSMPLIERQKDPLMEELEFIKLELDKRSRYGEKLADILVKSLKRHLEDPYDYGRFLSNRLPSRWYPMIKMNNDNTPYVEFISKDDMSDEAPDDQFKNYPMSAILVSQIILQNLRERERRNSPGHCHVSETRVRPTIEPPTQKKIRQYPERMAQSTPKKPTNKVTDLNDSRRVLPPRACKSNTTFTYSSSSRK